MQRLTRNTNYVEYIKAFIEMPKPPRNFVQRGEVISDQFNLGRYITNVLKVSGSIVEAIHDPVLNRIGLVVSDGPFFDSNIDTIRKQDLVPISNVRPLIIEVTEERYGNSLSMTPASAEIVKKATFIIFNGKIYRADKDCNINLHYAIFTELYSMHFSGKQTEDENRIDIPGSRMAIFYKPGIYVDILNKNGLGDDKH